MKARIERWVLFLLGLAVAFGLAGCMQAYIGSTVNNMKVSGNGPATLSTNDSSTHGAANGNPSSTISPYTSLTPPNTSAISGALSTGATTTTTATPGQPGAITTTTAPGINVSGGYSKSK